MTRHYDLNQLEPAAADLAHAVTALRAGDLVAFPTETVYGLGADAANPDAVRRLYAVKRRPADHPVIVHVARAAQLDELASEVPDPAHQLAQAFWPGPLTIVVRRDHEHVAAELTGGRDTVGLRVPDHPVALRLLELFGGGVAAPSANRFGRVSPTTAAHVRTDLGTDVTVVLDGGTCRVGLESTIVDVTGPEPAILRVGGVARADIEETLGRACIMRTAGETAAPGTLAAHYAPRTTIEVVDAPAVAQRARQHLECRRRPGVLAFGSVAPDLPDQVVVLDAPRDVEEYARVLYARLREADALDLDVLLVVSPHSSDGLGAAVADRVRRAATTPEDQ
jgi:L-threonylcarbamoyladenylate synthase